MQIRSRRICAGQIGRIADLHLPEGQCTRMYIVNPGSRDGFELTIPGTGYPYPGGYDELAN
ncbi:MAG: hypothetical protein PHY16_08355 [Methylobacter sp.]|nr:hypothetical protein [Methylobacter sp.]